MRVVWLLREGEGAREAGTGCGCEGRAGGNTALPTLGEHNLLVVLLAIGVVLVAGRGAAEIARRLRQPEVLGELLGGVLLGPSALGALFPDIYRALFLDQQVAISLSLLSWIGAILLLLIAGIEVDLGVLRVNARPGLFAAAFAIVPSIVAGILFGRLILGLPAPNGVFLGLVLSVTAVSVAAKILIERESLRRAYAQVILAAGIVSEVLVWLLISIVSALRSGSPVASGIRATIVVVLFFALMMTVGRSFTFWAMRRTSDLTSIVNGELTLVLVLTFLSAAVTQALGLHPLLGAFVFGVLLGRAPRATQQLKERVQTLTVGFFAPIFFVLAGMRVDILELGGPSVILAIVLLFVVATVVKVGFSALGAKLGTLRTWESVLVGVGLNLKGGTDVIVAILGAELGLLSVRIYTMYAVVAILTVLFSPPIIAALEPHVPPSREEMERLNREEAKRRAYLPHMERVLAPATPELQPEIAASVLEQIARSKQAEQEIFDVTQFVVEGPDEQRPEVAQAAEQAHASLEQAKPSERQEITRLRVNTEDATASILAASQDHDLIAVGALHPSSTRSFSLGTLQDRIIDQAQCDVLVAVADAPLNPSNVRRILVPVNGFGYSLAAGDVAAYLAQAMDAELVLFTSVSARLDSFFWQERSHRQLLESGYQLLHELDFRVGRMGLRAAQHVEVADDAGEAILRELRRQPYQLVVMGAAERAGNDVLYLGSPVQTVLAQDHTPAVLLITHA